MVATELPNITNQNLAATLQQPSDPPSIDDFVRSFLFEDDLLVAYKRQLCTKADLVNGIKFTGKMSATLAGVPLSQPGNEAPAWFQGAMVESLQPLRDDVARLERRLTALERSAIVVMKAVRLNAIMYNEMRVGGEDERFEVVFFPNGDDPTVTPHFLPALTSRAVIRNLSDVQIRSYYRGYWPGGSVARQEERHAAIYSAIGVRKDI